MTNKRNTLLRHWVRGFCLALLSSMTPLALAASVPELSLADAAKKLSAGGYVLMIRHAQTEGGPQDPPAAKLSDCATQLRLSAAGKEWARKLGAAIQAAAIRVDDVASSEWCRAKETAELAFGKSRVLSPLNVYFPGMKRAEARQTGELLAEMKNLKAPRNVAWVTHQVNITSLSGFVPPASDVLVLRHAGGKAVAEFRFKPVP